MQKKRHGLLILSVLLMLVLIPVVSAEENEYANMELFGSTISDSSNAEYSFANLPDGFYKIKSVKASEYKGEMYYLTGERTVIIQNGNTVTGADVIAKYTTKTEMDQLKDRIENGTTAAFSGKATVSGTAMFEMMPGRNMVQQNATMGIFRIPVEETLVATATSDAETAEFGFANLPDGFYKIRSVKESEYKGEMYYLTGERTVIVQDGNAVTGADVIAQYTTKAKTDQLKERIKNGTTAAFNGQATVSGTAMFEMMPGRNMVQQNATMGIFRIPAEETLVATATSDAETAEFGFADLPDGFYEIRSVKEAQSPMGGTYYYIGERTVIVQDGSAVSGTDVIAESTTKTEMDQLKNRIENGTTAAFNGKATVSGTAMFEMMPGRNVAQQNATMGIFRIPVEETLVATATSDAETADFSFVELPDGCYKIKSVKESEYKGEMYYLTGEKTVIVQDGNAVTGADVIAQYTTKAETDQLKERIENGTTAVFSGQATVSGTAMFEMMPGRNMVQQNATIGIFRIPVEETLMATVTSDAETAEYSFADLPDGCYKIRSVKEAQSPMGGTYYYIGERTVIVQDGSAVSGTDVIAESTTKTEMDQLKERIENGTTAAFNGQATVSGTAMFEMMPGRNMIQQNATMGVFLEELFETKNVVSTPTDVLAEFSANTTSGDAPLTVQFTDESVNATSWFWDFGDGTNSTMQNPLHTYDSVGSHTVALTITTPDGNGTEVRKDYITANLPEIYKDKKILFLVIGAEDTCRVKNAAIEMGMHNVDVYGSYRMNEVDNLYSPFNESIDTSLYDIIFITRKGGMSFLGANLKLQVLEMMENKKPEAQVVDWNYGVGTVNHTAHPYIADYWDQEYDGNIIRLITYLSVVDLSGPFSEYDGTIEIEEPAIMPEVGIYHPDANTVFDDLESYLEWYGEDTGTHHVYNPDNYTVGVTFFTAWDEDVCDGVTRSVIKELESRGINAIPAYRPDVLYSDNAYRFFTIDGEWKTDAFIDLGKGVWIMSSAVRNTEYLEEANVPVINGIIYQGTIEEWENSSTGQDCWFQYQIPIMEIGGEIESIVVGGQEYDEDLGARVLKPIDYQVDWMIDRTVSWIDLQDTENEDKKVAIIYYAHGKQSALVASNLDVVPSIPNLLNAMKNNSYDLGGSQLNDSEFLETVLQQGRNIGVWAPGELEYMVENYDVELLPVETYMEWFNTELEPEARQSVLDTWGEAPGSAMVYENESGKYFVFPKIEAGNVLVLPQPARGFSQNDTTLYHDQTMPPSHHYIAFYLWLENGFDADSIVHFGRHGTQEWLQGKGTSLSVKTCWPAILIQDTPVVYLYDVGGIGEGITAKRRGNAVMVDHSTPAIVSAGLYGNLTLLHDKMHYYETEEDPVMAEKYRISIVEIYDELNFEQELNVSADELGNMNDTEFENFVLTGPVHDYLHELASEYIPYGLHILGEQMDNEGQIAMVKSLLGPDFEEHVKTICEDPHEVDVAHSPNILDKLLEDVLVNETSPTNAVTSRFNTSGTVTQVVASATSDETGTYEFTNVKDGDYTIYAAKYIDAMNFWMVNKESLHIENNQDMLDKDICIVSNHEELDHVMGLLDDAKLIGEGSVSGKTFGYTMEGMKNISGSHVALKQGTEILEVTETDAEGAYTFTDLTDGEYSVVAIYYSDSMNFWMIGETAVSIQSDQNVADQNIELKVDNVDEVDAILSELPIASISGKTFSNGPMGLTNLSDSIVVLKQGTEILEVTETDSEGTYSFTELTDGEYTIVAINYVSAMQFWVIGETTVSIQSAQAVEDMDLELNRDNNNDAEVILSLIEGAAVSGKVYSNGQMGYMDQPGSIVIVVQTQADISKEQEQVVEDLNLALLYAENIRACKDQEIQSMINALEGKYIPPALGDDPVRSPDVMPTGKNFFAFNPSLVPTEEAWDAGKILADAFLEEWYTRNNEYPRKVGFVLWSGESMRHKGVMESEILYMMGVRPVWDSSGNVIDVEIIPEEELGRPRIDSIVTMTGIYRDNWKWQVELMDRGARLAAMENSSAYPNYVSENSDLIYEKLMATGNYSEEEARQLSMCRIFGPDEGSWGAGGFREAVSASGTWEEEKKLANLYIDSMSYAYGDNIWGNCDGDVFREVLSETDAVMFSRSGNDNRGSSSVVFDHVYEFFGGFGMAVRNVSGDTPEMYIANLKDPNQACVETLGEFLTRDLRTKYFNPKWIEGMMGHDYTGASQMDSVLEDFFGLGVTLPDEVTDDMWNEFYDVYVLDKYELGLEDWFQEENPWARQSMEARMLEAVRKGYWDASEEVVQNLVKEYVESVVQDGVTCCHHTCGNPLLDKYVTGDVTVPGLSQATLDKYNQIVKEATHREPAVSGTVTHSGSGTTSSASIVESTNNQTTMSDTGYGTSAEQPTGSAQQNTPDNYVEGYEMTKESINSEEHSSSASFSGADILGSLMVVLAVGVIAVGFRRQRI